MALKIGIVGMRGIGNLHAHPYCLGTLVAFFWWLTRPHKSGASGDLVPEPAFSFQSARRTLRSLDYTNIKIYLSADKLGWEADAPYGGIIVTAGAPRIPNSLLEQLVVGGKMVIPVGQRDIQELYQITRHKDRNLMRKLGGCRFVPLIGEEAW